MKKILFTIAALTAVAATPAYAGGVHIGFYSAPQPVRYYAPAPVIYSPAPVAYYYAPQPVYYYPVRYARRPHWNRGHQMAWNNQPYGHWH